MANKETAVEYLMQQLKFTNKEAYDSFKTFWRAKQIEKEQMIKFAQIVLDKAECSHTGMVYLDGDIEDIYNKTYKQ